MNMLYKQHFRLLIVVLVLCKAGGDICTMPSTKTITHDLNCYAVLLGPENYTQAASHCETYGGHLIFLETSTEQQWLRQDLISLDLPTQYWTGACKFSILVNLWYWHASGVNYLSIDVNRILSLDPNITHAIAVSQETLTPTNDSETHPFICEKDLTGVFVQPVQVAVPDPLPTVTNGPMTSDSVHGGTTILTPVYATNATTAKFFLRESDQMYMLQHNSFPELSAIECARECFNLPSCALFVVSTLMCSIYKFDAILGSTVLCGADQTCYQRF